MQYIPTEERYLITQTVDNVNIASNGIDVASFILDDAMEISDKGTTLYDKSIVDFNHILPSVVKLFVEEARSRNIVFRTEQPFNEASYVFIDRIRIAQVLRSILDNAFRCTSDGGSIVICVTKVAQLSISSGVVDSKHRSGNAIGQDILSSRDSSAPYNTELDGEKEISYGFIRVEVDDTGKGMTEEEIKDLFNQKYSSVSGMNYGLKIANMIVKDHDGGFGVSSNDPNTGSSFYFELPLASDEDINNLPHDQNAYW